MNVTTEKSPSNPPKDGGEDNEMLKSHLKLAIKRGLSRERKEGKELDELFIMIQLIDNILSSNMTLTKQQNLDYCKSQRYLMKLYMKKVMEKT